MSDTITEAPPSVPRPVAAPKKRNWIKIAATVLLVLFLVALPILTGSQVAYLKVAQYILIGTVGGIGLTLLVGQAGQLSLAHPFFLLVGAVSYAVLAGDPAESPGLVGLGFPPLLAVIGAVVICGLVGLAFAPVAGRLRGIYLGVASLSLVFLGLWLGQSLELFTGGTSSGRPPPTFELFGFAFSTTTPAPTIAGVPIQKQQRLWYLFLVFALGAYFLARGAINSRIGRSWRAVRDNEAAATAMGVNVARVKAGAFTISSAFAGLAGVMTALWLDLVKPDENEFTGNYSLTVAIAFLAIVIIGGLGSVPGAVVGAIVVYGLQQFFLLGANQFGWFADAQFGGLSAVILSAFVYGAAVVLVVLFEPGGAAAIGRRLTSRFTPRKER
ncbi:branched-chain amino acid ABC transporter permease [Pseudonocardia sp. 73-21]|uniref:branched-chain amino acid ABC transporter permease n=1 Tax=Pseudonocardia sp. 73-21 TaxID=1895809 RepID=UPI000963C160|nr:branched-chain amino acid ABC transporter permease [Pseudonocardia sp. 73-21]OJY37455.1 MAG: branched-chain amino acid ABC transporter permease [Pseudonocardia sp. 73-21]